MTTFLRTTRLPAVVLLVLVAAPVQAQAHKVVELRNVDYVPHADYRGGKDRLDLYIPEGAANAPVMLSLHGGVLMAGDRSEERFVGERFAAAGYVTVIPSYRLSPEVSHPAHVEDAAAAFAWVKRNIRQHGGDPDRILVIGHSAGAYLAMLLAADPRYLAAHQLSPRDIKGVVPVSGFFWVDKPGVGPDRPASIWGTNRKTWIDASPAHYLRAELPPVLLLDTDGDEDWRQEQNADFAAALRAAGHRDVATHKVLGRSHMSVWTDMSEGSSEETSSEILKFAARVLGAPAQTQRQTQTAPIPMVSAQVTGPGAMFPGLQRVPPGTGLADQKYVVKEYFVSGTANGKPYTTRILVRQPEDPKRFGGIVVAEPMHASGNSWMFFFTRTYMMRHGYISVEIAPQKAATEATIVASNPQRYARINIPEAEQANEILAQVGALLKGNGPTSPLAGMRVRRLVMMGTSQSSGTLRAYLPAHAAWRLPDGKPIYDGFLATSTAGMPIVPVDVPLIQIATQTEVNAGAKTASAYRRADGDTPGDRFRLYEIAGMPHNDSRENPTYDPDPCKMPVTRFPVGAMMAMGLHHVIAWTDKGVPPPRAERIVVENGAIVTDENGNAKGGVRSTYVDVPVAKYTVPNSADPKPGTRNDFYCGIAGIETPLAADRLRALYKDASAYRARVRQRLDELTKGGWFLPEYAGQVTGDAEKVHIPE